MHLFRHTMSARAARAPLCHLVVDLIHASLENKKCRARAPPRTRFLASTNPFHNNYGTNSFLKLRATLSRTTSFIKMTKVLSF